MQRTIALLRAINVGGRTVQMDHLRRLFEELGLADVSTFIASGNVSFLSADGGAGLEEIIEAHLARSLGYPVAIFLRSPEEVAAVAGCDPFSLAGSSRPEGSVYVAFLKQPPSDDAAARLLGYRSATDDFAIIGREAYWRVPDKLSSSPLFSGTFLEKTLGQAATLRNITTVRKLAAKYPPA